METAQQHQPADCDINELSRRLNALATDYQQFRLSVVPTDIVKEKRVLLRPQTPSLFHGQPNENIDSWLYELELYFEAMRLPTAHHQQRILFTKAQLRGAASAWFQHLDTVQDITSQTQALQWEEFKNVLTDRFRQL